MNEGGEHSEHYPEPTSLMRYRNRHHSSPRKTRALPQSETVSHLNYLTNDDEGMIVTPSRVEELVITMYERHALLAVELDALCANSYHGVAYRIIRAFMDEIEGEEWRTIDAEDAMIKFIKRHFPRD